MKQPLAHVKAWRTATEDLAYKNRRKHRAEYASECNLCDEMRRKGDTFHPSHDASKNCESGKRKHCSCDICF